MLKGVIFDLDGVITDTAKFHYEAWRKLAKHLGIELEEKFNEELKGISRKESLKRILESEGKLEQYDEDALETLCEQKNRDYVAFLDHLDSSHILPGVEEFIESLRKEDIKIGLASVSKNARRILEKLGIDDKIDYISNPATLKSKPAPDIFIDTAKSLGLDIDSCVGIEDSKAGVEALRACNMKSVGICVDADLRLESTKDLNLEKIKMALFS